MFILGDFLCVRHFYDSGSVLKLTFCFSLLVYCNIFTFTNNEKKICTVLHSFEPTSDMKKIFFNLIKKEAEIKDIWQILICELSQTKIILTSRFVSKIPSNREQSVVTFLQRKTTESFLRTRQRKVRKEKRHSCESSYCIPKLWV